MFRKAQARILAPVSKVRDDRERQGRQDIGEFHLSTMHPNRPTAEQIVRLRKRDIFRKFDRRVFPQISDSRETKARREPRRDDSNPFVCQVSRETDATFRKDSAREERQIFATLEKISVLAAKSQHSQCKKHLDAPVRTRE